MIAFINMKTPLAKSSFPRSAFISTIFALMSCRTLVSTWISSSGINNLKYLVLDLKTRKITFYIIFYYFSLPFFSLLFLFLILEQPWRDQFHIYSVDTSGLHSMPWTSCVCWLFTDGITSFQALKISVVLRKK